MAPVRPSFSRAAMLNGVRVTWPLLVALVPFALVVGVVAQGQGLSLLETVLMSATSYAGSAQLLALTHWSYPAPVLSATIAAFVVNLRLALMGPVIGVWLDRLRGWRLWGSLFLLADQNWALSVQEIRLGRGDAGFLFGSGLVMWVVWVLGTGLGYVVGEQLRPTPGHPIFFAAAAIFVAILAGLWRGHRVDLVPWLVAGFVSVLVSRLMEGSWYIILGAIAGAAAGVLRDRRA